MDKYSAVIHLQMIKLLVKTPLRLQKAVIQSQSTQPRHEGCQHQIPPSWSHPQTYGCAEWGFPSVKDIFSSVVSRDICRL